jgi:tetratricopeptide (TPR) repeat protein
MLARHMVSGSRVENTEQALAIAREQNNLPEIAFGLWRMAGVIGYGHNYARGLELGQESLALYQQLNDAFGISRVLHDLAYFYGNQGQIEKFIDLTRQSIDIKRSIGDRIGLAHSLYNLGASELLAGNLEAAEAYYRESLEIRQEMRDLQGVSISLSTLSAIAYLRGSLDQAQRLATEALEIATDIHNPASKGYAQVMLGLLKATREEDYAAAKSWCEEGARHNTSNRTYLFLTTHCFVVAYIGLEDYESAQQAQRTLLQMAMTFGGTGALGFCLPTTALIIAHEGQDERAVELLGLVCTLRSNPVGWIEQSPLVTRLRQRLESTLGSDAYDAAWTRGTQQNLRQVTTELLQEFD